EDKPNERCVVWDLVERTVDITQNRNAEDEVNPAKKRTRDVLLYDFCHDATPWIWSQCRTALRIRRPVVASRRTSWHRCRPCVQSDHLPGIGSARRGRCASRRRPT